MGLQLFDTRRCEPGICLREAGEMNLVRAGWRGRGDRFILLAPGGRSDCRALASWLDPHDYFSYRPGAKKFQNKLLEYADNVNGESRKLRRCEIHGGWLRF